MGLIDAESSPGNVGRGNAGSLFLTGRMSPRIVVPLRERRQFPVADFVRNQSDRIDLLLFHEIRLGKRHGDW